MKGENGGLDNPEYSGTQANGSGVLVNSSMIIEVGKGEWKIESSVTQFYIIRQSELCGHAQVSAMREASPTICPEDRENWDTGEQP